VIHISVDGLRGDFIQQRITDSPHLYPHFTELVRTGASTFNARTDYTHTVTLPNHTSMITGRPVLCPPGSLYPQAAQHGYVANSDPRPDETLHNSRGGDPVYIASTFDVIHDHGLSTALYVSKDKFVIYDQSYDAAHGAADHLEPDHGPDKIDAYVDISTGSPATADDLHAKYIEDMASRTFNYTFLHLRDPDTAGHADGWGSPSWDQAVQNVDRYLGDLIKMVQDTPGLKDDAILIITADHGGTARNHGESEDVRNYTIPVIVWGAGVAPGADLYELNRHSRLNPADRRPTYDEPRPPIRNGDTGNLALSLLGLPPIPGSMINVGQDLNVGPLE
jgi:predicted AlkP superfamily pyrophosphatase or phosphodiesterase